MIAILLHSSVRQEERRTFLRDLSECYLEVGWWGVQANENHGAVSERTE